MPIFNKKLLFLVLVLLVHSSNGIAIDTSKEEAICYDIGFKPKTENFGNCVLELVNRKNKSQQAKALPVPNSLNNRVNPNPISKTVIEQKAVEVSGDGSTDDITCQNYGFKPGTSNYSECRQKIDLAKQDLELRQAQYEQHKRQYEAQQAQIEKDRKFQASQRLFDMSQRLMSGQSYSDVGRAGMGLPPLQAPTPPGMQTYVMPNGRAITCSTTGTITNCF